MSGMHRWRKSSYSGQGNTCVEVAASQETVSVRDSKNLDGPPLRFSARQWRRFTDRVKSFRS